MLAAANENDFDNIEDYLRSTDRFKTVEVVSPNPIGTGTREQIDRQVIELQDGTTRLETELEAIFRINAENDLKRKQEEEAVKNAERRQGIGIVNKMLNIFGTPTGEETYMVDGQEVTYTPGAKAQEISDIELLKEKGIIQDEEEVDSTPFMTKEQGEELLKLYITTAGLLNQPQANAGMRIAPMYTQRGLQLKVDDPYKKRRI